MEYGVHIITLGQKPEVALAAVQHSSRKDKIWILNKRGSEEVDGKTIDYFEIENKVIEGFHAVNILDVETWVLENQFDYYEVYHAIIKIAHIEREKHAGCKFYINFTKGTSIMSGAACSAAYLIGANLYYIQESKYNKYGRDEIIKIPIDRISEISLLNNKRRTKSILETIGREESITHSDLMKKAKINNSALSPHIKTLKQNKLIENTGTTKFPIWIITDKGRNVLNRLD